MSSDIEREPWRTAEYGNLALVRAVKKRPCLYNTTMPEYSQKDITRAAWEEIAEEFGCPVDDLKRKWKVLRTIYSREVSLVEKKKKKKPYYLAKYMDFLRPYLKSQPLHAYKTVIEALKKTSYDYSFEIPPLYYSGDNDEVMEAMNNMETSNDGGYNVETVSNNSDEVELNTTTIAQHDGESDVIANDSSSTSTVQPVIIQCIKTNQDSAANNYSPISAENPRRQFLSSLLPEVDEMTEKQFRNFKRKVFQMIDDVLLTS